MSRTFWVYEFCQKGAVIYKLRYKLKPKIIAVNSIFVKDIFDDVSLLCKATISHTLCCEGSFATTTKEKSEPYVKLEQTQNELIVLRYTGHCPDF